jgi:hypothetical protein
MGLLKSKSNSKKSGKKGFFKLLSRKGRVHFLAKKCCVNVQKAVPGRKAGKGSIMQIDVNNLYQRKLL